MESSIGSFWFYYFLLSLFPLIFVQVSCKLQTFILPHFTGSYVNYIANQGAFLTSTDGTFQACISSRSQAALYYLAVIHAGTNSVIWVANRNSPITDTGEIHLTVSGLRIIHSNNKALAWSTPPIPTSAGAVSKMQLMENGNLVLLNQFGKLVWQSFDYPTNTITIGQVLAVGMELISPVSDSNISSGDYQLLVKDNDAVLLWKGHKYWTLSSTTGNSYIRINQSGLYIPSDGDQMLKSVRFVTLDYLGHLKFLNFSDNKGGRGPGPGQIHVEPATDCLLPFSCGRLGLCLDMSNTVSHSCSCSTGLNYSDPRDPLGGCLLPRSSESLSCTESSIFYLELDASTQYFANNFTQPTVSGVSLLACQNLCSKNCSCFGFFYANSSSHCHFLQEELGSLTVSRNQYAKGYLKLIDNSQIHKAKVEPGRDRKRVLPLFGWFLICFSAILVTVACFGLIYAYRRKLKPTQIFSLCAFSSTSDTELNVSLSIPGLPVRFSHKEIEEITNNFNNLIGSGGFGVVYKGTFPLDNSEVAVKKISSTVIEGKKGFYAEITAMSLIRHVNLVKLHGFCKGELDHFLVYEFMNRGSLDHLLFGSKTILDWSERVRIALGTANGLAYLHEGCANRILHLDVKPANILLDDQLQVKIADFGLSKLLGPEQSRIFTALKGTRGYLAPEWLTNGTGISDKSDVYSYGMVLLEIIRGSKNCLVVKGENGVVKKTYFPKLALEMYKQGRSSELADPRLEGKVQYEQVEMLVKVALCCLHKDPRLRPTMINVVRMIQGKIPVGMPQVNSLRFLEFYGRESIDHNMTEPSATSIHTEDDMLLLSYLSSEQISGPR